MPSVGLARVCVWGSESPTGTPTPAPLDFSAPKGISTHRGLGCVCGTLVLTGCEHMVGLQGLVQRVTPEPVTQTGAVSLKR